MRSIPRWLASSLVVVLLGGLTACTLAGGDRVVTEKDNGTTVGLGVGNKLTVVLQANATTGYAWQTTGTVPPMLRLDSKTYKQDTGAPGAVGVGGVTRFAYTAQSNGEAPLAFVYVRPWEKGVAPAKTFRIEVEVR